MNFTGIQIRKFYLLRLRVKAKRNLLRLRANLLRLMTSPRAIEKYQAIGLGILFSLLVFIFIYLFTFLYVWIKF
jgi:dolichol kinase